MVIVLGVILNEVLRGDVDDGFGNSARRPLLGVTSVCGAVVGAIRGGEVALGTMLRRLE